MNPNPHILLIGGSGFIGSVIAAQLVARGCRVTIPTRRRERARQLLVLPTVEVVDADIGQAETLARLVAGKDAVIYLPGLLHSDRTPPFGNAFKAVHVDLPTRVMEACVAAGVPRYLHMSALGAASDAPSMYQRSKAAGEAAARSFEDRLAVTIFRPSVVFGVGDKFSNLFAQLSRFAPFLIVGGAHAKFQPIHVDDVATAFVNALFDPATVGCAYDLGGPTIYSLGEFIQACGRVAGVERAVFNLPKPLALLQALVLEQLPGPLLSRDNLASLEVDNVLGAPVAEELGIKPAAFEAIAPSYLR